MSPEMLSEGFNRLKPYVAIIALQFGSAGMLIITMISLKGGMSHWILVVYRHVAATLAIAPFALVLERKIRPKMTLSVFWKILLLAFLEPLIMDSIMYYLGMTYTSATHASEIVNSVLPALTFIMTIIFRLERVNMKRMHSQAKVIGTLITVTGALVMTLYKGPIVDIFHGGLDLFHTIATTNNSTSQHWVIGTILVLMSTAGWSGFFIVQSMALKEYPAELSLTALVCVMGIVESGVTALIMERDMGVWYLGFDNHLLTVVYSGVVCSGIAYYVQGVVNKVRGPMFVTAFNPLCMIITAVLGATVFDEQIHLGSIIGAVIIVMGLCSVVWGKSKDHLLTNEEGNLVQELPIVDTKSSEIMSNVSRLFHSNTFPTSTSTSRSFFPELQVRSAPRLFYSNTFSTSTSTSRSFFPELQVRSAPRLFYSNTFPTSTSRSFFPELQVRSAPRLFYSYTFPTSTSRSFFRNFRCAPPGDSEISPTSNSD